MANVKKIGSSLNVTRVEIEDNSDEIKKELNRKLELALEAIGGEAEKHAKENCPVDTGRLRNSITFATESKQGNPNGEGGAPAEPDDYRQLGTPSKDTVYVGTNVSYAEQQEYFGKKAHFIRNSISKHTDDYKRIIEAALDS